MRWGSVVWGANEDDPSRSVRIVESRPRGLGAPGPPKSGRAREVALSRRLRAALEQLYRERWRPADDVFVLDGLDPGNFYAREWRRIRDRAGLGDLRYKDLRSTFASQLLTAGVPLAWISRALGHSSPVVTAAHYSRWLSDSEDGYRDPMVREQGEVVPDFLARLSNGTAARQARSRAQAPAREAAGTQRPVATAPRGAGRRWETSPRRKYVGRLGIEPRTNGLKARCSAS